MLNRFRSTVAIILLLLIAAGCATANDDPSPAPTVEGPEGVVLSPIPEAPEWRSPSAVITRDNVSSIEFLGRLDVRGTTSTVFDSVFSPDFTQIVGLNSDEIILWDLITGERVATDARAGASTVLYAPDKSEIYTLAADGLLVIHNPNSLTIDGSLQGLDSFNGVYAFDENTGYLALGGDDGQIRVWDLLERTSLVTYDAVDAGGIQQLVFSPEGRILAAVSVTGNVQVWDWQERTLLHELDNLGASVRRITFSPDGSRLAVGTFEFVNIWDVETGEFVFALQTGVGGANDVLEYSPDGRFLISGGDVPDMIVWDGTSGELVALLPDIGQDVTSAAFSPDGELLLASVLDGPVTLWDMTQSTEETVVRADLAVGTDRVLKVQLTPDGFAMLFFDAVGPIYVWGIPPGEA